MLKIQFFVVISWDHVIWDKVEVIEFYDHAKSADSENWQVHIETGSLDQSLQIQVISSEGSRVMVIWYI